MQTKCPDRGYCNPSTLRSRTFKNTGRPFTNGTVASSSCPLPAVFLPFCPAFNLLDDAFNCILSPIGKDIGNVIGDAQTAVDDLAKDVEKDVVNVAVNIKNDAESVFNTVKNDVSKGLSEIEKDAKDLGKSILKDLFDIPIVRFTIYGVIIAIIIILLLLFIIVFIGIARIF